MPDESPTLGDLAPYHEHLLSACVSAETYGGRHVEHANSP